MSHVDWFAWLKSPSLHAAAALVLNGGRLFREDARRVINELQDESVKQIMSKVEHDFFTKYFPTNRVGPAWKAGQPSGLIDHYTAGTSGTKTLRWFSSRDRGEGVSNSSAHYVLDRDGVVFQLINPLERVAWHARADSYTHIGIEHVNTGFLRKVSGQLRYLNIKKYPDDRVDRVQSIEGEPWEPYTVPQIVTNIVLKRWLIAALPSLIPQGFIDHEMADPKRKRDCGPLWPLHDINALAFSDKPIRDMRWMDLEYLSQVGVYEFHREVQEYLR